MSVTIPASDISTLNQSIAIVFSADQKVGVTPDQVTPGRRINEQESYGALAHQALKRGDPKLATRFESELKAATEQFRTNHGNSNMFKITDRLMRQYVREKALAPEKYRAIRDHAFGSAQLDSNRTDLGIKKSPESKDGDTPVRAISTLYKKLENAKPATPEEFAQFRAAEAEISKAKWRERRESGGVSRVTGVQETGASIITDGVPGGFLWKPQSDSDGRLVVLLPPGLSASMVNSLSLRAPRGDSVLETGRYSGIGNGGRLHFRFGKSGGNYPDGTVAEVKLVDGSTIRIPIRDTASRVEG